VLNFVEKSLDKVALTVECIIAITRLFSIGFRRDYRGDIALFKSVEQRIGIKSLSPIKASGSAFSSSGSAQVRS
jgi:hypothetical protein